MFPGSAATIVTVVDVHRLPGGVSKNFSSWQNLRERFLQQVDKASFCSAAIRPRCFCQALGGVCWAGVSAFDSELRKNRSPAQAPGQRARTTVPLRACALAHKRARRLSRPSARPSGALSCCWFPLESKSRGGVALRRAAVCPRARGESDRARAQRSCSGACAVAVRRGRAETRLAAQLRCSHVGAAAPWLGACLGPRRHSGLIVRTGPNWHRS